MSDNKKGLHTVETPVADPSEGLKLPYGTDTTWEADTNVHIPGEWHKRHDRWREEVDLGTCDTMTAYAAGRVDGYAQAIGEFLEMWKLFRPFYEMVQPKAEPE